MKNKPTRQQMGKLQPSYLVTPIQSATSTPPVHSLPHVHLLFPPFLCYLISQSMPFHFPQIKIFTNNMAAEQLSRRDNNKTKETEIHVEKERVPQLASHFEAIAVKPTIPTRSGGIEKPEDTHELAAQFESLADKVRDKRERQARAGEKQSVSEQRISEQRVSEQAKGKEGEMGSRQNQPSLEEISNYRALSQEKSNEAIRAAKERYDKANKESLDAGTGEEAEQRHTVEEGGQQAGLETLTTAAKTAKEYTAPIAEKAKDYTVSAGQTTAHFIGEKAVAAKDVAAEYAGKAAEDLKDKAVVAGWSTAHYSCDTAVEGTKAAARMVKGAAEYAGAIAAKPLSAAKNVAESAGENAKEYTARKKEEAQRESMYKQGEKESMYEETKESFERGKEGGEEKRDDGGIVGAIGETIYEIAQTTKEMVIGAGDQTGKQSTLGFELGQEEGEEKDHGYEKEYYQTATRKESRA